MSVNRENINFRNYLYKIVSEFNARVLNLLSDLDPSTEYGELKLAYKQNNNDSSTLLAYFSNLMEGGNRDSKRQRMSRKESIFMTGLLSGEAVSDNIYQLSYYGTEICYGKNNSEVPKEVHPVTGYHFDFDKDKKSNHPIFHAQNKLGVGTRIFSMEEESIPFIYIAPVHTGENEIRSVRIPTPQMDIFSAIIMIIADYIVHPSDEVHSLLFSEFLKSIDEIIPKFNVTSLSHIHSNFKLNSGLCYWYPMSSS